MRPDATVAELFDHHVSRLRLRAVPVVDGTRYHGMVFLRDIAHLGRGQWEQTPVGSVAQTEGPAADITWSLGEAVQAMESADVDRLPVLADGAYVGMVTTGEILKLDHILDQADAVTG